MERWCCYEDSDGDSCSEKAKWEIFPAGSIPYHSTDACTEHVGDMLSDAFVHNVYNIEVHE